MNKGSRHTLKALKKIRKNSVHYWRGKKRPPFSEEWKEKLREQLKTYSAMRGKHHSEESKKKMSMAMKGKNSGAKSYLWKGGITTYERKLYLNARRRAREKGAEGSHTFGEWELLKKQYGYKCPACGKQEPEIRLGEDHIIPLIKGGSNYIENIQPLCKSCNCKKNIKIIKYAK